MYTNQNQKVSVTRGLTVLQIIWLYMNYAPKNVHITFYTVTGLYACLPWWASQRSSRNFWMKLKRAHFVTAAASQTAARSSKRVHYKNVFWLLKNCFVYLRRDIVHWIKLASCSIKSLATFFANSCFLTKKLVSSSWLQGFPGSIFALLYFTVYILDSKVLIS